MPVEREGGFGYWRDPLFLACLAIYAVNRGINMLQLHSYSPFFNGHLNDTLTVPVAIPVYLLVYRWIGFRPDDATPRWWEIVAHVAVWIVFFEWYGPLALRHGVADPVDSWCMAIGGVVAWIIWSLYPLWHRRRAGHVS